MESHRQRDVVVCGIKFAISKDDRLAGRKFVWFPASGFGNSERSLTTILLLLKMMVG